MLLCDGMPALLIVVTLMTILIPLLRALQLLIVLIPLDKRLEPSPHSLLRLVATLSLVNLCWALLHSHEYAEVAFASNALC